MLAGGLLLAGAVVLGRRLSGAPFDFMVFWLPRGKEDKRPFLLRANEIEYRLTRGDAEGLWRDLELILHGEKDSEKDFGSLSGAVKVCVAYKRGAGGKIRCKQWSSGAGYVPGPQPGSEYSIPEVRAYYATELCSDPKNKRRCGLSRRYHYRRSLPYVPRERAKSNVAIPSFARTGAVRILNVSPAPPLQTIRTQIPG